MAKSKGREYVWLQCTECSELNYRTEVKTAGGAPKLALSKYCWHERRHTEHKLKRK